MQYYMTADMRKNEVKAGTLLVASGTAGMSSMCQFNTYVALKDAEEGIFESRPFIRITKDNGSSTVCHLSRFQLPDQYLDDLIILGEVPEGVPSEAD